jgi:predicted metal-binding protein
MTVTLTVCETCGFDADAPEAVRPGERLAQALEAQLAAAPQLAVALRRTRCLMACKRHCTVLLRAPQKIGYVIGDFAPDRDAAATLLEYLRHYTESPTGQVAYRLWPEGIKGRFIARIPHLDE